MAYQELAKARKCPLDLAHKAGALRKEWYVHPSKPGEPGDRYCADCSRAKSKAKRERQRAKAAAEAKA